MQTSEAALYSTPLHDIYLVLGESNYAANKEDATLGIRLYITPGQQWIWIGFILVAIGGAIGILSAFTSRRSVP